MTLARVVLGIVVVVGGVIYGFGSAMPPMHVAAVTVRLAAPPERVYDLIADVGSSARWRSGIDSVHVHPDAPLLTWTEYSSFGPLTLMLDREVRPRLFIARIADESGGFGGTWTYELERDGDGTHLTITERGLVQSALFRFASRYVLGLYRTMETYARDLGRQLGEDVQARRLERSS